MRKKVKRRETLLQESAKRKANASIWPPSSRARIGDEDLKREQFFNLTLYEKPHKRLTNEYIHIQFPQ
jgi:hypothetical protein